MTLSVIGMVCGRGRGAVSGRFLQAACDSAGCTAAFQYLEGDNDEVRRQVADGWVRLTSGPARHACPTHSGVGKLVRP